MGLPCTAQLERTYSSSIVFAVRFRPSKWYVGLYIIRKLYISGVDRLHPKTASSRQGRTQVDSIPNTNIDQAEYTSFMNDFESLASSLDGAFGRSFYDSPTRTSTCRTWHKSVYRPSWSPLSEPLFDTYMRASPSRGTIWSCNSGSACLMSVTVYPARLT